MATAIVFLLLAGTVSLFVALPLIQSRSKMAKFGALESNHRAADLVARKESIYAAIKEIEFDHEMGKLSDEDFHALREQYKQEAVNLLKKIDEVARRQAKSKGKKRKKGGAFCWVCGTAITAHDKFCANCGTKLK